MTGLDDIDREIPQLLMEDARRPYRVIAEQVDRSPPLVSDRIERLRDVGSSNGSRSMLTDRR